MAPRARPTVPPRRSTRSAAVLTVLTLLASVACIEHEPSRPGEDQVRLAIPIAVNAVATEILVDVSYARSQGPPISLLAARFAAGTGSHDFPLSVAIAPCLADPDRSSDDGSCPLLLTLALHDETGATMDSMVVGPLRARAGEAVQTLPVTLSTSSSLVVESGDNQVGWVSQRVVMPVVVRLLDRDGTPLPGRPLRVVAQLDGSTMPVTSDPARTGPDGRALVSYTLTGASGTQLFEVLAGTATTPAVVTTTAVPVSAGTVSPGGVATCAARASGSFCLGSNIGRALGNPAIAIDTFVTVPVSVATSETFVAVTSPISNNISSAAFCGLNAAGRTFCWGANDQGQLGVPPGTGVPCQILNFSPSSCLPAPTEIATGQVLRLIRMGGGNSNYAIRVCGVTQDGDLLCWGENPTGAIGDGTTALRPTPVAVGAGTKWISVSTGHGTTCGVEATGRVQCWGEGTLGQLGDGSATPTRLTPAPILSTERFQDVGVGQGLACGLTVFGQVHCWGREPADTTAGHLPHDVSGGLVMVRLSVALSGACGLTDLGEVWCRGSGNLLGNGSSVPSAAFVRVALPGTAIEVSAGVIDACAVLANQDVYCWGQRAGPRPTRVAFP